MARVRVDPDRCVGHGRCYALAPEVYDADDVGHCVVRQETVEGDLEAQARVGAENCPESAIHIET
jgi:ferredoxin